MAEKDYLNRDEDLQRLIILLERLSSQKKGCTFAINGSWGCGKSFLLNLLEAKLRVMQSEESADESYFIVRYDCWKNNYYTEPVVGMLSELMDVLNERDRFLGTGEAAEFIRSAKVQLGKMIQEYSGKILENKLGFNPISFYQECKNISKQNEGDCYKFDDHYSVRKSMESIRKQLEKIAENKTIVFIVDELDRCLPDYAIKILENFHHLFSGIGNVVIILALDKNELAHIVQCAYGNGVDTDGYLRKIIDFYVQLDIGNLAEQYMEKYSIYCKQFAGDEQDLKAAEEMIYHLISGLDIRMQERIMARAEMIHSIVTEGEMDISCMVFEIMSLVMRYYQTKCTNDVSGKWQKNIIRISKEFRYPLGNLLPEIVNFEKYEYKAQEKVTNGKRYICLEKNIVHMIVWFMENLKSEKKNGYCGKYYFADFLEYEPCVQLIRRFENFAEFIQ